ncbi:MAG: Asp23/Gls24 family envelope stress response protein [Anaerolineae bacterium]|nr:Asp23/Gls24 family envelope stress response protein [Anaerolineae bacterium]
MAKEETASIPGRVEITPEAIASIVSQTVLTCYGVVGMASRTLTDGLVEILQGDSSRRGVEVHVVDDRIVVDLYVVLEYGTRIVAVAENVKSAVKFAVERQVGVPVEAVNVHVQGLRVSDRQRQER